MQELFANRLDKCLICSRSTGIWEAEDNVSMGTPCFR